jgi:hypothetical protein
MKPLADRIAELRAEGLDWWEVKLFLEAEGYLLGEALGQIAVLKRS